MPSGGFYNEEQMDEPVEDHRNPPSRIPDWAFIFLNPAAIGIVLGLIVLFVKFVL